MDFMELAAARYSERKFADTPVDDETLGKILAAGNLAPTAKDSQPQRITVVRTPEGLQKVDRATPCRFGAPVVLVLGYSMAEGVRHPDVGDYGPIDMAIVGTHMMLEAADLGVHSCWVGLIDPGELRRQLGIDPDVRIMAVMPLGYPHQKSRPSLYHRRRKDLAQTVSFYGEDREDGAGCDDAGEKPAE